MTDFTNPEAFKDFNKSVIDQHRVSPLAYFRSYDSLISVAAKAKTAA